MCVRTGGMIVIRKISLQQIRYGKYMKGADKTYNKEAYLHTKQSPLSSVIHALWEVAAPRNQGI